MRLARLAIPLVCGNLIFGGLLWARAALAESAQPSGTIEEVVVTARRREETVQDVPIPVSALSGEDLRGRGAEDLRDLTRVTPNLDFQRAASAKNTAQVFLRGIGQVNWAPTQDPKIGTYVNGVYLGRPQGGVFDFLDIERVEVLRGPQGTLFGRNTTAGLVHIISNKPTDEFDYRVNVGVGNDGGRLGEAMVNVPISDTFAGRLAVQHRESDGFVENTATGDDWNDENSQTARLSFRFTPNDQITADLILDYQRVRELPGLGQCEWGEPDNGAESTAFLPSVAFILGAYDELRDTCNATRPYKSSENDPAQSDVDAFGATLDLNFDLGWADLTSITAYREIDDISSSWGWGSDTIGSPSFLEVLALGDNEAEQWSQEFRLAGSAVGGDVDWVVGVYAFDEQALNQLDVPLFRGVPPPDCAVWPVFCIPSPSPFFDTLGDFAQAIQVGGSRNQFLDAENSSVAVFGEATWRFAEDWAVTAGARWSRDKREFTRTEILSIGFPDPTLICPEGIAPVNGTTCNVDQSFTEVTPRVIFSYDVNEDVMLYMGWSRGYSSGGFNQDVRMRPFEPEISGNWEGGIKSTLLDNRLVLNLTGFHNSYENQQITVGRLVDGNPTADLINAQEATLYGLEAEFRAELPLNWYLQGAIGWIQGDYDEFTVLDNQIVGVAPNTMEVIVERDLADTKVVRGAPYTYSFSLGKFHTFDNGSFFNGQVGWAYRGRTYNTLESFASSRQGKYGLLDARLTYTLANGRTSFSLWGTNLTDREYYNAAIDLSNGPSRSGTNTKYWGEPLRMGFEIAHSLK